MSLRSSRELIVGRTEVEVRVIAVPICILALWVWTPISAQTYPWWMTARFERDRSSVEAFTVQELDPSWSSATVLSEAILPVEALELGQRVSDFDATFEATGDFDGDGRGDRAVVGVYETRGAELGRFLLVLTADAAGGWRREALFEQSGPLSRSSCLGLTSQRFMHGWSSCACPMLSIQR